MLDCDKRLPLIKRTAFSNIWFHSESEQTNTKLNTPFYMPSNNPFSWVEGPAPHRATIKLCAIQSLIRTFALFSVEKSQGIRNITYEYLSHSTHPYTRHIQRSGTDSFWFFTSMGFRLCAPPVPVYCSHTLSLASLILGPATVVTFNNYLRISFICHLALKRISVSVCERSGAVGGRYSSVCLMYGV